MVVARYNTGVGNKNYYQANTMTVVIKNRVPSAHERSVSYHLYFNSATKTVDDAIFPVSVTCP